MFDFFKKKIIFSILPTPTSSHMLQPNLQDYNLRERCNELFDFITLLFIPLLYTQFNSIMGYQALPQYIVTKQKQPEGPFMKTKEKGEIQLSMGLTPNYFHGVYDHSQHQAQPTISLHLLISARHFQIFWRTPP